MPKMHGNRNLVRRQRRSNRHPHSPWFLACGHAPDEKHGSHILPLAPAHSSEPCHSSAHPRSPSRALSEHTTARPRSSGATKESGRTDSFVQSYRAIFLFIYCFLNRNMSRPKVFRCRRHVVWRLRLQRHLLVVWCL